ncbi:M28 family peptidase [Actinomadura sp. NEAU-AAG7]|uniref:M28 family peptidase n=1 Tax=Actinomadura sp. NEAU-AAG7 TaxID=2839640 RepID=UPI0027E2042B|nr:M28 family peptidase [Actinomadura sp. NEAU-AAG7]
MTTAVTALALTGVAAPAMTSAQGSQAPGTDPKTAAMASADRLVAGNAAALHAGKDEKYIRTQVVGTPWDQYYVAYERTYRDVPVVGGDFVVATDGQGRVRTLSVAQQQQITVGTTPKISQAAAAGSSRAALTSPDKAEVKPRLVVHALAKPRLAWESVVTGRDGKQPSRKKVYVDAQTGKRFDAQETIHAGTGTGIWEGSNLTIGTTQSGSTYTMRDPKRPGLTCADYSGGIFSGPDDTWGSTSKTSKEAGCVDTMYAAAGFWDLLKTFGRDGLRNGQWAPARVGLNAVNAYWNGTDAQFGHNQANQWITSTDVVDHEFGHGLDNFTPGGMSGGGTQEFVGDVWGASVEAFLNNPVDKPDYTVGEEVNLVGQGPIRNMYNPSQVNNDPNCYSSSVPRMEVHKAAGPGNHWFYLLAEGSNPGGGKPNSPVCQGGQVTGIGVLNAAKIFYNAMNMKTSGTSYPRYRTLTLSAAKNLDKTCDWFNKVKAAWDAVQLGAQSGDPTCTPGATTANTVGGGLPKVVAAPDINVENVKAHLQQLQTIASQNGGNRRSTGGGYLGSVSYVEQKLKAAGFTVTRQACSSGCTGGAGPNLIADWPGGNENNVYMFGAHLDSVGAGPGINDDGSGSAALLETALQLAQSKPTMLNHVRFGWWTDEEQGLRGSQFYTSRLPTAERSKIKGYFNFDMVGSPNAGYFIDYLNSPLSANLKGYFDSIKVPTEEVTECCSDDGSFRNIGVPTSTLSTGAGMRKSSAQAQKWGGTAGQAFDRCYHQSCDSYPANINTTALDRSADSMAWALWKVAVGGARAPDAAPVSTVPETLTVSNVSTVPSPDINVENVKGHLQQLQTIATQNGGTRRSTGAGYLGSVSYIEQKLKAAGFTVTRQACSSGCTGGAGPNLIADWPGGNENNVYMFGAHLDSVGAGPGINDNGTGSSAQLEVALQLAQSKPTMLNHVRFGWWTDEEQGLRGSKFYVGRLSTADRSKIKGYFNFDMVGSPNPGYFIDDINSPTAKNLKEYFDSINVPTEEVAECCSDDGSFRNAGIPTTFLFTGAPATKTAAQAKKWGGTAGQAFDRCYHQACDRYPNNVDTTALDRCSDAIAHALWKVAVSAAPAPGNSERT